MSLPIVGSFDHIPLVTYKLLVLGDTIRQARLRKSLTQAHLAKLAGVSRRHLAALEKGANVSVSVLQRIAGVLELEEIQLGDLAVKASSKPPLNVPLLTDTIREARADAERANLRLAQIEGILGGAVSASFPRLPVRRLESRAEPAGVVRELPGAQRIETAGEIRQGRPLDTSQREMVAFPEDLVGPGDLVFRFRGAPLAAPGIEDGDLLIAEKRARGAAANGELVIARMGTEMWIGHWWQKDGRKRLMTNGLAEVTTGSRSRPLKVVAAVNQIVRGL
jgi:transcriptional regulator with XRE-family HTH domain